MMILMALYLHLGPFAATVTKAIRDQIALVEAGSWQPPRRVPIPAAAPGQTPAVAATAQAAT
jgi:hypothetical protein